MILKIIRFIRGFLIVEITGNALERFINQINDLGINLWHLKRIRQDCYQAKIYASEFHRLRPLVKRRKCWINITKKRGLPFILLNIKHRMFLLFGLILFIFIFYLGSNLIISIQITGLDQLSAEKIEQILTTNGIKRGMFKQKVATANLSNELRKKLPRIAWANVKWQGSKLVIEIVEKKVIKQPKTGNLLAAKDGLISKLIVLKGQAVVKEGDTVIKGQPLIVANQNTEEAAGIVQAHVWYQATGEAKLKAKEIQYTGKSLTLWGIKLGDKIFWLSPEHKQYAKYERVREIKTIPKWRNIVFPLEIIKEKQKEITYYIEERSLDMAKYLAKEEAMQQILKQLDTEAVILAIKTEVINDLEKDMSDMVQIRVLVKTEENIARHPAEK